jgi:N-acyl-D-aspartate/D-glutamate deacylase
MLNLKDRGLLRPGMVADITVFALDELHYDREVIVDDLPGGKPRLTRPDGGYRSTIVGGVVVQEHGKSTGKLPARFLRAGAA